MSFDLTIPQSTGENLNFTIDVGETLFVLGANGTGKSSLMQLIYRRYHAIQKINQKIEDLSIYVAEKAIRAEFFKQTPKKEDIVAGNPISVSIDTAKYVQEEKVRLQKAIADGNLEEIISRYKVRSTQALDEIATKLEFPNRKEYEDDVRKLLKDNKDALNFVRELFGTLASDIEVV